jgi:hypothetical protein
MKHLIFFVLGFLIIQPASGQNSLYRSKKTGKIYTFDEIASVASSSGEDINDALSKFDYIEDEKQVSQNKPTKSNKTAISYPQQEENTDTASTLNRMGGLQPIKEEVPKAIFCKINKILYYDGNFYRLGKKIKISDFERIQVFQSDELNEDNLNIKKELKQTLLWHEFIFVLSGIFYVLAASFLLINHWRQVKLRPNIYNYCIKKMTGKDLSYFTSLINKGVFRVIILFSIFAFVALFYFYYKKFSILDYSFSFLYPLGKLIILLMPFTFAVLTYYCGFVFYAIYVWIKDGFLETKKSKILKLLIPFITVILFSSCVEIPNNQIDFKLYEPIEIENLHYDSIKKFKMRIPYNWVELEPESKFTVYKLQEPDSNLFITINIVDLDSRLTHLPLSDIEIDTMQRANNYAYLSLNKILYKPVQIVNLKFNGIAAIQENRQEFVKMGPDQNLVWGVNQILFNKGNKTYRIQYGGPMPYFQYSEIENYIRKYVESIEFY